MNNLIRHFLIFILFFSPFYCLAQGKITHPQRRNTPTQQEQTNSTGQSLPTTVAGYKLGITTRSGAEKYTFDKGYSLSYPDGTKLTAHYVDFAGYIWNDVELYFHQNKLYKIVFSKPDVPSEHKTYGSYTPDSDIFSNISNILSNKYSKYSKGSGTYNDGRTTVTINSHQLIYTNDALNRKATNSYDSL